LKKKGRKWKKKKPPRALREGRRMGAISLRQGRKWGGVKHVVKGVKHLRHRGKRKKSRGGGVSQQKKTSKWGKGFVSGQGLFLSQRKKGGLKKEVSEVTE